MKTKMPAPAPKLHPCQTLAPREVEIVALLHAQLPDKLIADKLGLRPRSVSARLLMIYKKLGVTGRGGAMLLWHEWAVKREVTVTIP